MSRYYSRSKRYWHYERPKILDNNIFLYVRDKFFEFDHEAYEQYINFYKKLYGSSAASYLRNTYPNWKNGSTKMAGETCNRILKCAPKFMSIQDQFHILALCIPLIHEQVIGTMHNKIEQDEIEGAYSLFANQIENSSFELDWFVKEAFSTNEIQEFKEVVKYTLLKGLTISFENVKHDLIELSNRLLGIDAAIDANYNIAFLNCVIPINKPSIIKLGKPRWIEKVPNLGSKFSKEFRQLLIEDAVHKLHEIQRGELSQQIAVSDLRCLKEHFEKIAISNELKSSAEFTGKGGKLRVEIHKATRYGFQITILKSTITALLITAGFVVIGYFLTKNLVGFFILLILFGWIILFYAWGNVFGKLKEAKEYGRKRKRFAKN